MRRDGMALRGAAARWASVWRHGWEARDPDPIVELYAPGALVWIEAFREPARGPAGVRAYLEAVFADERDVRAWFGQPVVGDGRVAVEWWAVLEEAGRPMTLAGVSVLRFDGSGLVVEQRDSWNRADGRREPGPGWGREDVPAPT
jgi:hypothetical protein